MKPLVALSFAQLAAELGGQNATAVAKESLRDKASTRATFSCTHAACVCQSCYPSPNGWSGQFPVRPPSPICDRRLAAYRRFRPSLCFSTGAGRVSLADIKTPNGGRAQCLNLLFSSLLLLSRPLRAAWNLMVTAPLPVPQPVLSLPVRPTTTFWSVPVSALPPVRFATTRTSVTDHFALIRAAFAARHLTTAIGALAAPVAFSLPIPGDIDRV